MSEHVLSMVGDQDPLRRDGQLGPLATFFTNLPAAIRPTTVWLLWTPGTDADGVLTYEERAKRTAAWLRQRDAGLQVEEVGVGEADASDFERIAPAIWRAIEAVLPRAAASTRWHIHLSSGSQQMAWAWITAVQVGLIPARLWQTIDPARRRAGSPVVMEFQVGRAVDAFLAAPDRLAELRSVEREARQLEGALARLQWEQRGRRLPAPGPVAFPVDLDGLLDLVRWNLRQRALDDAGQDNAWTAVKRTLALPETPSAIAQRTRAIEARLLAGGLGLRLLPVDQLLDLLDWFTAGE